LKETIIKAKKLTKIYKLPAENIAALGGVDFEITKGDFVSLVGPSGSGKTTLLNIIGCLDGLTDGYIEVLGQDVSKLREKCLVDLRRKKIGFVFQESFLIPTLTALENVELSTCFGSLSGSKQKARNLLEKVGLGNRLNHFPRELSGGQKQRVAIARALINDPKLLIADEPTGRLDTKIRDGLLELFSKLSQAGLTIVIATHDLNLAKATERIIYLKDGKIVSKDESGLYY